MVENPSSNLVDQQIEEGVLTQEMLHFLQKSVLAGISMLFISSKVSDAVSFLTAFIDSMKSSNWPGFVICHVREINDQLLNISASSTLAQVSLGGSDIETVTAFQKIGTLILDNVSHQSSLIFLQALQRGQVIAVMKSEDPIGAIMELSAGINEQIPQVSAAEARAWLVTELGLIVHLRHDLEGKMRAYMIDGALLHNNALSYIYMFDEESGDNQVSKFKRKADDVSFMARLLEVGSR